VSSQPAGTDAETLGYGPTPRSWRFRVTILALVAVLLGSWAVVAQRANSERNALSHCAQTATSTVDYVERRLAALAAYIAPAVSKVPPYPGLGTILGDDATRERAGVSMALHDCRSVSVWWMHPSLRRARDAYVALMAAELRRLDRMIADGNTYYHGYHQIARLQRQAAHRLRA